MKGGTIREIVYDFLSTQSSPIHISAIWKFVEQYRGDTYARSVLDNLKADESNKFIFLDGSFIGLHDKIYDLNQLKYKRLIGSLFTKSVMQKYNGWDIVDFIEHYQLKYGYQPVQTEYVLMNKIESGDIFLTQDNKLSI